MFTRTKHKNRRDLVRSERNIFSLHEQYHSYVDDASMESGVWYYDSANSLMKYKDTAGVIQSMKISGGYAFNIVTDAIATITFGGTQDLSIDGSPTFNYLNLTPDSDQSYLAVVEESDGAVGPHASVYHDSASPAASDSIGTYEWFGNDAGDNQTGYTKIVAGIVNPAEGSEAGALAIFVTDGGSYPTLPNSQLIESGLALTRTDDGTEGMALTLKQKSASPAIGDEVGYVKFVGDDDAANTQEFAQIAGVVDAVADGSEEGRLMFKLAKTDGTVTRIKDTTVDGERTYVNAGTAGTNVTEVTYGDGRNMVTVLTLTNVSYTVAAAANEAIGNLIYTFPAGAHIHEVMNMSVALQGGGTVDADTPVIGIGSVEATGAVAVLNGTATFMDYITEQTAADCGGTATTKMTAATAGYGTGISLNESGDAKTVYLNIADGWAGADTVLASGTVVIKWTKM